MESRQDIRFAETVDAVVQELNTRAATMQERIHIVSFLIGALHAQCGAESCTVEDTIDVFRSTIPNIEGTIRSMYPKAVDELVRMGRIPHGTATRRAMN
jgi:hypothetical protein